MSSAGGAPGEQHKQGRDGERHLLNFRRRLIFHSFASLRLTTAERLAAFAASMLTGCCSHSWWYAPPPSRLAELRAFLAAFACLRACRSLSEVSAGSAGCHQLRVSCLLIDSKMRAGGGGGGVHGVPFSRQCMLSAARARVRRRRDRGARVRPGRAGRTTRQDRAPGLARSVLRIRHTASSKYDTHVQ
eukprot:COSAG02_NODE_6045_length_3846_cov_5.860155_2_plen_188_part_00